MLAFTFDDPEDGGRSDPDLMRVHIGPTFDGTPADAAETGLFHDILLSDTARRVLNWWLGLSRDGRPPMKSALTVRGMAPFISSLALIDCDLTDDARVRIAGHEVEELIGQLDAIEDDTDQLQAEVRAALFVREKDLPPVDVVFMYQAIEWIGEVGDYAQRVGSRLQRLLAR